MTKIKNQEDKQFILDCHNNGMKNKEIKDELNKKGIEISESTIRRIILNPNIADDNKTIISTNNDEQEKSFKEIEEEIILTKDFNNDDIVKNEIFCNPVPIESEKVNITREEYNEGMNAILKEIMIARSEKVEEINKELKENNNKLDELIKKAKLEKVQKPMRMDAKRKRPTEAFIDELLLSDSEVRERDSLITKVKNYVDNFSEDEDIIYIVGDDVEDFKLSLYTRPIPELRIIYKQIQTALNSQKDVEMFLNVFANSLKFAEFLFTVVLGIKVANLSDEVLATLDINDLKMIGCELSASRYLGPYHRIALNSILAFIGKIIENGKWDDTNLNVKYKLLGFYKDIKGLLGKGKSYLTKK